MKSSTMRPAFMRRRLNEQQLKDTAAFFKSPAGVAYVQAQPALMTDLLPAMQTWSLRLATDMMTACVPR